jgi:mono/diheme cytochrome c family protein
LTGGTLPGQGWYAPSLQEAAQAGVPAGALDATVHLLKTGVAPHGHASGPMAQVVQGSTQHLSVADLQAVVVYLQSLGGQVAQAASPPAQAHPPATTAKPERSAQLYEKHCADCHGLQGAGVAGAYPALAQNRAVNLPNSANLIQTVLYGGFAPTTEGNPRPFGMPPFMLQLSDQDSADLLTYIRSAWGNHGAPVTVQQVTRVRDQAGRY